MTFTAKASTEEEFQKWVEQVKQSTKHLTLDAYQQLAKPTEYHPVEYYSLEQPDLFDWVMMKYMAPPKQENQ